MFGRRTPSTLEEKLAILAQCGLTLAPPFTTADLLESWSRDQFERPGFDMVLVGLGMTEERPPWRSHSINVWHFDTECIYDQGDYRRIAERMKEMAQGSLPIENIHDYVDLENPAAWLAFDYQRRHIRIDCQVKDDWVDEQVFIHFVDLLAESDPCKIYLYHDLGGQDCIIACVLKTEFKLLKNAGIDFRPLT